MPNRMPEGDTGRSDEMQVYVGPTPAPTTGLVDEDVSWLSPTVDLLRETLPAGPAHPIFVPLALYKGRRLLDRILLLAYLHWARSAFPGPLGEPEPAELVAWVTAVLQPAEQGFLARCLRPGPKYGRVDALLAEMTTALGMQTCLIVARRVARPRFGLSAHAPLVEDLAVEMSTRCLPVPARLRRRSNARDGYFVTYKPKGSFEAYVNSCFFGGELEGVLKDYGRSLDANKKPREIVLPDLVDFEAADESLTDDAEHRHMRARLSSLDPPAKVWRHFEHAADGRTRACCATAARWVAETRERLNAAPS